MFRISKKPLRVWWPVKIPVPADNGKTKIHPVKIKYEILDLDEQKKFEQSIGDVDALIAGRDVTHELLDRVIVDWEGFFPETGNKQLKFSKALCGQLLNKGFARAALAGAYFECAQGRQAKN